MKTQFNHPKQVICLVSILALLLTLPIVQAQGLIPIGAGRILFDFSQTDGVVGDYFDYGATVTYTDPAYGLIPGFVLDQRVPIQNLSNAIGGRGYAW